MEIERRPEIETETDGEEETKGGAGTLQIAKLGLQSAIPSTRDRLHPCISLFEVITVASSSLLRLINCRTRRPININIFGQDGIREEPGSVVFGTNRELSFKPGPVRGTDWSFSV